MKGRAIFGILLIILALVIGLTESVFATNDIQQKLNKDDAIVEPIYNEI